MISGWHPITLTGDYNWYSGAAEGFNARSLNVYSVRIRTWQPRSVQTVLALLNVILDTNLAMTPGSPWRCALRRRTRRRSIAGCRVACRPGSKDARGLAVVRKRQREAGETRKVGPARRDPRRGPKY